MSSTGLTSVSLYLSYIGEHRIKYNYRLKYVGKKLALFIWTAASSLAQNTTSTWKYEHKEVFGDRTFDS